MIQDLHGKVLSAYKGERIHNCPLHANLKVIAIEIRFDFLENARIIKVEKQHSPIKGQEFFHKVKNEYTIIFPLPILEGNFWRTRNEKNKKVFWNIGKNKVNIVLGLMCTWWSKCKNRRRGKGHFQGRTKGNSSRVNFMYEGQDPVIFLWPLARRNLLHHGQGKKHMTEIPTNDNNIEEPWR